MWRKDFVWRKSFCLIVGSCRLIVVELERDSTVFNGVSSRHCTFESPHLVIQPDLAHSSILVVGSLWSIDGVLFTPSGSFVQSVL